MIGEILQLAIIAVILIGIVVSIRHNGQSNPVPTGKLNNKLSDVDGDLRKLGSEVDAIKKQVEDIDRRAASKGDIRRLEKLIDAQGGKAELTAAAVADLRTMIAARATKVDEIGRQVDRLYNVIVTKGMD